MNKFRFLQTMQLIDDEFLEEAYVPIRRKTRKWHTSIAVAACIGLCIGIGAWNMVSSLNRIVKIIVSEVCFSFMELTKLVDGRVDWFKFKIYLKTKSV